MVKEMMLDFCGGKSIYIYGAGQVGKQCLSFFRENGIQPVGFAVTDQTKAAVDGVEVFSIDSIPVTGRTGFILAGSKKNCAEMQTELIRRGIKEYVFYREETEEAIQSTIRLMTDRTRGKRVLFGTGMIAKAVKERLPDTDDEVCISDSVEDPIPEDTSGIVIAEDEESVSDAFIRLQDKARERGITLYDGFGRELNTSDYQETELAKRSGKYALVIDVDIPPRDKNAGARLSHYYMYCLKRMGYSVWLLPLNDHENGYKAGLEAGGIRVVSDIDYRKLWLYVNGGFFDLVFLQRPECADYYLDYIKRYCTKAKLIYHPADLHHIRLFREYELSGDEKLLEAAEKYKKIERKAISESDLIYVVGSKEREIVQELFPGKTVRDIPIYLYEEGSIPDRKAASARSGLIFVGGFSHNPNMDAVKWLAGEIMPRIVAQNPGIICRVVGSNATDEVRALENKHLIIEGFVSDERLKELYQDSRLALAPLRFGAGVKGKVIEAAYYGLPMITTSIGTEGVHEAERFIKVADTAEAFASSIVDLYDDLETIDRIAGQTKDVIEGNYTEKIAEDILRSDLEAKS